MKYLTKRNVGILLASIFVIIQFFKIDKTNPPVDLSKDFIAMTNPSPEIRSMIKGTCYDCHSHEVTYPWYSDIAPVSWWIKGHVDNGVKHLNFSLWGDYSAAKADHKLEENVDMMEKHWMPILTYKAVHSQARLSDEEYIQLSEFFKGLRK